MKALTLWQPWAEALALGIKKFETRGWYTHYRGPIVIHASVKPVSKGYKTLANKYNVSVQRLGEIVAVADLTDCIYMTSKFISAQSSQELDWGFWEEGRYAWKLENIRYISKHTLIKGKQGLWNIDDEFISDLFDIPHSSKQFNLL